MIKPEQWHRHLGAYGICLRDGKLLVIRKNGGPYTKRFDLPGGTIEPNESLTETVHREFLEETGLQVRIMRSLGTRDYVVAWTRESFAHTHCHHIAVLYEVEYADGDVADSPCFDDSDGAEWIDVESINEDAASPLVLDALRWVRTGKLPLEAARYDHWQVQGE
ncbi:NUDIX hydrolase [Paenibacillus ginsengarvi]|nr:NUDIX hydrolase [Paenibacillus ginsengarvi]